MAEKQNNKIATARPRPTRASHANATRHEMYSLHDKNNKYAHSMQILYADGGKEIASKNKYTAENCQIIEN